MPRTRLPRDPGRKRMIAAVQSEYRRISAELAPQLAKMADPEQRAVNVAQNVIRDCLTALLTEMTPYTPVSALEMARRSASYALSVVPLEDQDELVAELLGGFAEFHLARTASGAVITAYWEMQDGRSLRNFPEPKGQK